MKYFVVSSGLFLCWRWNFSYDSIQAGHLSVIRTEDEYALFDSCITANSTTKYKADLLDLIITTHSDKNKFTGPGHGRYCQQLQQDVSIQIEIGVNIYFIIQFNFVGARF